MLVVTAWTNPNYLISRKTYEDQYGSSPYDCSASARINLQVDSYYLCCLLYYLDTGKEFVVRFIRSDRRLKEKSKQAKFLQLNLRVHNAPSFPLDYLWNWKIQALGRRTHELEKLMWLLSSLGGAFSAMGDHIKDFAYKAQKISFEQLKIAFIFGDLFLVARCRLFIALSHIQTGNLRLAARIIKYEYRRSRSLGTRNEALGNICKGVWAKLQYVWKTERLRRKQNGLAKLSDLVVHSF